MKKLLVVVDFQKDFVDGALGFDGADKLEPGIYDAVQQTLDEGGCVLFTRDTHEASYADTREGHTFTTPHCIAGTEGHRLYGRLAEYDGAPHPRVKVADKLLFSYMGIGADALALCGGEPELVELCGLVTDICVAANALLLHTSLPNATIAVRTDLVDSFDRPRAQKALDVLAGMGIRLAGQPG